VSSKRGRKPSWLDYLSSVQIAIKSMIGLSAGCAALNSSVDPRLLIWFIVAVVGRTYLGFWIASIVS
jgi:hypothetical protein